MNVKRTNLLAGVVVLTIILLTGYQPVLAAPPTGEVKIMTSRVGKEVPIPYVEFSSGNDYLGLLYDPLVGCNPQTGKLSTVLGVANKWEMSRDGLTWTFYLRKGVKFHDGVELTAKDVKFSIEQYLSPDATMSEGAFVKDYIKSIDLKDPYTVIIRCKQPAIFMPNYLSNMDAPTGMIIPKDYYERVGRDEFQKHPIGSGPYKWHSQMVGSFIKLEATDKHWRDGVPRYKYMSFLIIPEETTRLAMLRAGEADISIVSRGAVKDALSAGLNLITKQKATVLYFNINMQWESPVFGDVRFRKALNLALDKEAIINQLFAGLAKPVAMWPGSNVIAVGGDPKLKPYPYDPQEARRLIKEGGWEGHEFTILSYSRAGCPEYPLVVEAMAGYWEKVGLKPKIRPTGWDDWVKLWNGRKSQNIIQGADAELSPDVYALLTKFNERWDFENRRSAVNIPELNERFRRIDKSLDVAEISKLLAEIYRYAYDQFLLIPVCEINDHIATTKRIPKWDPGLRRKDNNYYDLIKQ